MAIGSKNVIGRLSVQIIAATSQMEKQMAGLGKKLQNPMQRAGRMAGRAFKAAFVAAAAVGTIMADQTRRGLKAIDELAKAADRMGVEIGAFQALRHEATLAGMSIEQFDTSLRTMNQRLGQVAQGLAAPTRALDALNLSLKDLEGLSPDQQFALLTKRLGEMENVSERAAVAQDLFGRAGTSVLNMVLRSQTPMQKRIDQFREMGFAIDRVDAAKVEAANDAFTRLGLITARLQQSLAIQFAHVLEAIATRLFDVASQTDQLGEISSQFFDGLVRGAGIIADAFRGWHAILVGIEHTMTRISRFSVEQQIKQQRELVRQLEKAATRPDIPGAPDPAQDLARQMGLGETPTLAAARAELEQLESTLNERNSKVEDAFARLEEIINKPLPSDAIDEWVSDVQAAAERAAIEIANAGSTTSEVFDDLADDLEETSESIKGIGVELNDIGKFARDFGMAFEDALVNAAAQGKTAFKDLARFVLAELQRIIIRTAVLQPLLAGLGGAFGGWQSQIGAGLLTAAGQSAPGSKATGGILEAGKPYHVHQDEIITPGIRARAFNKSQQGGDGGINVTINQNFAMGVQATVRAEMLSMAPAMVEQTKAAVADAMHRSPSYRMQFS